MNLIKIIDDNLPPVKDLIPMSKEDQHALTLLDLLLLTKLITKCFTGILRVYRGQDDTQTRNVYGILNQLSIFFVNHSPKDLQVAIKLNLPNFLEKHPQFRRVRRPVPITPVVQ